MPRRGADLGSDATLLVGIEFDSSGINADVTKAMSKAERQALAEGKRVAQSYRRGVQQESRRGAQQDSRRSSQRDHLRRGGGVGQTLAGDFVSGALSGAGVSGRFGDMLGGGQIGDRIGNRLEEAIESRIDSVLAGGAAGGAARGRGGRGGNQRRRPQRRDARGRFTGGTQGGSLLRGAGAGLASLGGGALLAEMTPFGLSKVPGLLKSKDAAEDMGRLYKRLLSGSYGEKQVAEMYGNKVVDALRERDEKQVRALMIAIERAAAGRSVITDRRTLDQVRLFNKRQSTFLRDDAFVRSEQRRLAAVTRNEFAFDPLPDELDPTARKDRLTEALGKSGDARLSSTRANQARVVAEERLNRLRKTGKATVDQIHAAELRVARAIDSQKRAKDKANQADKETAKARGKAGLTAAQVVGLVENQRKLARGHEVAVSQLVRAGLSPEVIAQMTVLEKQQPGTLANLATTITPAWVKRVNAAHEGRSLSRRRIENAPNRRRMYTSDINRRATEPFPGFGAAGNYAQSLLSGTAFGQASREGRPRQAAPGGRQQPWWQQGAMFSGPVTVRNDNRVIITGPVSLPAVGTPKFNKEIADAAAFRARRKAYIE